MNLCHSPLKQIAAPLGGLIGLAALAGLTWAWLTRERTDTDLIVLYAGLYAKDAGNPKTDCEARPGDGGTVRLVIVCRPDLGAPRFFLVGDRGRLVDYPGLGKAYLNET